MIHPRGPRPSRRRYWGDAASEVATTDLAVNSVYTTCIAFPIQQILAGLVALTCASKYPNLVVVLQDLIASVLPLEGQHRASGSGGGEAPGAPRRLRPAVACALRLAIFAACTAVGLQAANSLGQIMSMVGGICSISCSLLLPTAFYLRLAWPQLGRAARGGLLVLLGAASCLIVLISVDNLRAMAAHVQPGLLGAPSLLWH